MHIVNSCANNLEHTEWSKLLNVHTLKTSRREHLARRSLSVRSRVKAEAFCRKCGIFVCGECIMSHQRMTVFFDGHEILSIDDEVKKARAKDVLTQNPPAKQCQLHDEFVEDLLL